MLNVGGHCEKCGNSSLSVCHTVGMVQRKWDYFLSYNSADQAWAEWISWVLEEAGSNVLLQAWDFEPGCNWVELMDRGVAGAGRTVAVLSAAYLGSEYGAAEWRSAWAMDPSGWNRKLIPVRVEPCERPGLLANVVGIDLFGVDEAEARRRLQDGTSPARSGRRKPSAPPPFAGRVDIRSARPRFPGALPAIWNVPFRLPSFHGRDLELSRIRSAFAENPSVLTLSGLGGVGKSQCAIEYAYRNADAYDIVWWINAEQPALFADQFASLAAELGIGLDDDSMRAMKDARATLRQQNRWLLILDNAEDARDVQAILPGGAGHVLVTTRRSSFGQLGTVLEFDVLERADAIALLRRRVEQFPEPEAAELCVRLGDLPLALEQAGAFLRRTLIPPREYLELLDRREPEVLARGEIITHADTVATVWSTSMDHIRKSDSAAVDLLIFCGYLAAEPIPLDLFTQHAALLPPPLDTILADPLAAAEAVGALADYSLLRRTDRGLVIHRLVQAVSRQSGLTDSRQPPLAVVLRLLVTDLPAKLASPDSWPRWRQMLGHVLAACGHHDDHRPVAAGETARLLDSAARYQRIHGDAQASRNLLERVLRIVEGMPDPHPRRVAHALGRLGWTLCGVGEPATARPLLERALALYEAALEPGHTVLINAMDNLGWALRELGDPAARPLIERTLSAYETACAAGQPENEQTLYNLGNAFMHLGDLRTARRLYERALLLAERTGPYGPHLRLSILHNLALLLERVDKPKKARRLCVQALALAESVYGPDHPELITLLIRLAYLAGGAASESAGDHLYRRALVLIEQHYGTDHPDHLWIKNHLNRDRN